jgi:hypothetical protein
VHSDTGVPPAGQHAVAALGWLAYEPRAPLRSTSGLQVHHVHIAASIVLDASSFSPVRIDRDPGAQRAQGPRPVSPPCPRPLAGGRRQDGLPRIPKPAAAAAVHGQAAAGGRLVAPVPGRPRR